MNAMFTFRKPTEVTFFNEGMAALLNTSCEDLTTKHKCTDPKTLPQQIDSMIGEGRMMHVSIKKEDHVVVTNVTEGETEAQSVTTSQHLNNTMSWQSHPQCLIPRLILLQNQAAPQRRCMKSDDTENHFLDGSSLGTLCSRKLGISWNTYRHCLPEMYNRETCFVQLICLTQLAVSKISCK
ncbi:uncharacterized protein LOC110899086 isoform X1 [Helianthus annuus]|uniref:uncharacterized protein LOC110899086 isoform X1 n=1 Tax=Helianthus annuus TaxID=4232 RepID=UPI0016531CF6|nr:uncharacterized protein LOC110899086 isoform X1 [Helianthus annuus]